MTRGQTQASDHPVYVSRGPGRTNHYPGRLVGSPTKATKVFRCESHEVYGSGFVGGFAPTPSGVVAKAGTTFFSISASGEQLWSSAVGGAPEDRANFVVMDRSIVDLSNVRDGVRFTVLDTTSGELIAKVEMKHHFSSGGMTVVDSTAVALVFAKGAAGLVVSFDPQAATVIRLDEVAHGTFAPLVASGDEVLFGCYFGETGLYRFRLPTRKMERVLSRPVRSVAVTSRVIACQMDETGDNRSDEQLWVLDRDRGKLCWSRSSAHYSVAVSDSHVAAFLRADQPRVLALYNLIGNMSWESVLMKGDKPRAVAICDDAVIARTWDGGRHILSVHDLGTGEIRARLELGEEPSTSEAIGFDSKGLVVAVGHTIYRVH